MYLERKIDQWLMGWKNKKEKNPALIISICCRTNQRQKTIVYFHLLIKDKDSTLNYS